MRRLFILVGLIASLMLPLRAQEGVTIPMDCTLETVQSVIKTLKTAVDAMDTLYSTAQSLDDAGKVQAGQSLEAIKTYVGLLRAHCDNLSFAGNNQQVIGPITIPKGVYRAVATTTGFMIVHVNPLEGDCGAGTGSFLSAGLFSLTKGQADAGAEAVMTSNDCAALIEVSNVQADWTLAFEKLN